MRRRCLNVLTLIIFLSVPVRRVPPRFSLRPEDVKVMPASDVNLTCVAVGSPMPYVKWRQGAYEITEDDDVPIGRNVLQLKDVKESRNYTCEASSDLGNIETVVQVTVEGKGCLVGRALTCLFPLSSAVVSCIGLLPRHLRPTLLLHPSHSRPPGCVVFVHRPPCVWRECFPFPVHRPTCVYRECVPFPVHRPLCVCREFVPFPLVPVMYTTTSDVVPREW